jgi:FMN phosphatase YigB (HAD superfamily)
MKLFVLDFHGFLERGNEKAVLEISNKVLERFGYEERFSEEENSGYNGLKWWQYFKNKLPEESYQRHTELEKACLNFKGSRELVKKHIQLNDHAQEVLEAIASKHYQILMSNTTTDWLKFFLETVGIKEFFPAGTTFPTNGITKEQILQEFLSKRNFEKVVTAGDSPADVDLAATVENSAAYLYAYPGNNFRTPQNPTYDIKYIRDLRELKREI